MNLHVNTGTRDAAPPRAVQAAVDDVLTTHGAYVPVELLLALGRLRYADYEAWRHGERPSLQPALAGNPRRVLALLEAAAAWAERLGLHAEPQAYFGWGANADERLAFLDPEWRASEPLLATHYVRRVTGADEADQFDLFLDSGATAALADVRAALRVRDARGAEHALEALVAREPTHRLRPAAERLADALAHLPTPLPAEAAEAELDALEHGLLPAAREVLGATAGEWLAPFWQRLAAAFDATPFDPERPRLHASYAHARSPDWPRAIAAVESVPDHAAQPALLARLADARRRDGDRIGAIADWCRLCWRAPEAAAECLDGGALADTAVRWAWLELVDLDLETEPDPALFPAYLLLVEPGLASSLPEDLCDREGSGESAFRAARELIKADSTEARRALRAAAPWLLDAYLEMRDPSSARRWRSSS